MPTINLGYFKQHYKILTAFAVLIAVYLIQVINVSPTDAEMAKYNLSSTQLVLISLTVALPNVIIWLIGLVGYLKLNTYANNIKQSKDGAAMRRLSWGILWLLLWLPITSVAGNILESLAAAYPGFAFTAKLLDLYIGIAILLPAYYFLFDGSRQITGLVKKTKKQKENLATKNLGREALLGVYAVVSAAYIYALFSRNGLTGGQPVDYLPDWVYLLTAVLPRLTMWLLGLMAVWNLYTYGGQIMGKIYSKSFQAIAVGLIMITVGLIAVVLISTAGLIGYSLGTILAIVYTLLIVVATGYVLVAVGATGLSRIEKV